MLYHFKRYHSTHHIMSHHVAWHHITSHIHTDTTIWYSKFHVTCLTRFCKGSFGFLICTKLKWPWSKLGVPSHCNHLDRCVVSMPCYPTAECRRPRADPELEVESRKGLGEKGWNHRHPTDTNRHQDLAQERQKWLWHIFVSNIRLFFAFFPL